MDEDLNNKSEQLIEYNSVHKKVPVLVHNKKAIVESLVILEYIDEIWKENSLLPSDPFDRAQARFWAHYIDDKIYPLARKVLLGRANDAKKAETELEEMLKTFEKAVEGKGLLLGGGKIGYLDIVGLFVCFWIPVLQEAVGKQVLTRSKFPAIFAWSDELLGRAFMMDNLPDKEDYVASYKARFAR